jgi:penicillin amidase
VSIRSALRERRAWLGIGLATAAIAFGALLMARGATEQRALRRAIPQRDGTIPVAGIARDIEIVRDGRGLPHIRAASELDAYFGLGFVHAQERLAQMSWLVRAARGTTAAAIGRDGLPADRWSRTLGLARLADARAQDIDAETRRRLEAYAAGVNAWIDRIAAGSAMPPVALTRLGIAPERWRPADSLAIAKLLAWALDDSVDATLALGDLVGQLGAFAARPFFPPRASDQLVPVPLPRIEAHRPALVSGDEGRALARAVGLAGRSVGSSAWIVPGVRAANGRPLLAGDLHFEPTTPSLLFEAQLAAPGFEVAGAGPPGVPVFWSGHNGRVAWVATHARAAVADLHEETLDPADPDRYRTGRRWRAIERREEPIEIRGESTEPWVVRSTHHGPLLGALLSADRPALSLAWAGAQPGDGVAGLLRAATARDAAAFRAALAEHHEPAFAVAYADAAGRGGRQLAGWIPRRSMATALVPVPGRSGWYDWRERVPFDELPHAPLAGTWLVTADNELAESDAVEWWWRSGQRAAHIEALLRAASAEGLLDAAAMVELQSDTESPGATNRVRLILDLAGDIATLPPEARQLAAALERWQGGTEQDSRGAAAWHVLLQALLGGILEEKIGSDLLHRYLRLRGVQPEVVFDAIYEGAVAPTPDRDALVDLPGLSRAVRNALRRTSLLLRVQLGPNPEKWIWGRLHGLRFRPFGWPDAPPTWPRAQPEWPYPGDGLTVAVGEYDPADPFAVRVVSGYRIVVDLADPELALSASPPGITEHPGDPLREAGLERWLAGRPALLTTHRFVVDEGARARLRLVPASPPAATAPGSAQ